MNKPYRYHISDLKQLSACKSNNSRELHLVTTVFVNDKRLSGTRVEVIHDELGVLYACTMNAKGNMVSPYEQYDEFTITDILHEIRKYGFLVDYDPVDKLSDEQIEFLETLSKLGFDKIRVLTIYKDSLKKDGQAKSNVTLFNIKQNPAWLNNQYCATQDEYDRALNEGSAFNVSALSDAKKFSWNWLCDFVADVDEVILDNKGELRRDRYGRK